MSVEQNKAIHRRWLEECWSDGDAALQDDLMTEDVVDHNPVPGVPAGLEGQRAILRMFRGAFDIKTRLDLLLADGDYVIGRWTATFFHKGEFMGMPATGRSATVTGIDISRFRDGKIAEIWHQEDVMSLLTQLGALPSPTPTTTA